MATSRLRVECCFSPMGFQETRSDHGSDLPLEHSETHAGIPCAGPVFLRQISPSQRASGCRRELHCSSALMYSTCSTRSILATPFPVLTARQVAWSSERPLIHYNARLCFRYDLNFEVNRITALEAYAHQQRSFTFGTSETVAHWTFDFNLTQFPYRRSRQPALIRTNRWP